MTHDPLDDFIEEQFEGIDPNDHFDMQRVASGRAGHFRDAEDQRTSRRHHIGHFWIVEPRRGCPDLISYLTTFADAPRGPNGSFELPMTREGLDRAWASMDEREQHLTPHHRKCWTGLASTAWPRGSVRYDPDQHLWSIFVAASLASNDDVIAEVRQRFTVDQGRAVIIPREDFEGAQRISQ